LKRLISVVLIGLMLLLTTAAVAIAAENATHEASEKENKTLEQSEKNTSVTQRANEEAKETVTKAKEGTKEAVTKVEEAAGKKQPGFESTFAAVSLLAVAFIALKRRS
jgi:hypothetical protein